MKRAFPVSEIKDSFFQNCLKCGVVNLQLLFKETLKEESLTGIDTGGGGGA